MVHNCRLLGKAIHPPLDGREEHIFLCSRCGACYVCRHKSVYFEAEGKWMWKCKDSKFREVILDGRLKEGETPKSTR
jgi:hypothetical protein